MGKTLMLFFLLLTFESTSQSSDKIYDKTNKPALFPGCERRKDCANDLLEKYIAYQIRNVHPTGGKVNVSFVVEPDGSLTNIEAQTEKGSKQAIESERIIQSMNKNGIKWLPGLIKDNPVR